MSETPKATAITPHTKHPDFPRGSDVSPLLGMISPVTHGTPLGLAQRYAKTGVEAHGRYSTVSIMAETSASAADTEPASGADESKDGEEKEKEKEEANKRKNPKGKETPELRTGMDVVAWCGVLVAAREGEIPRHMQQRRWRVNKREGDGVPGGGNHWRRRSTANWTLPCVCDSARRFRARSVKPMSSSWASWAA